MKKRYLAIVILLIFISCVFGLPNYAHSKKNDKLNHNIRQSIPVLMYHSITDKENGLFKVNKNTFYEQMKYLKDNNYNTLSLDEVHKHLVNNMPFNDKSVVITFDDGYRDNYKNAYPILKKFNIKATIFVITDNIDKNSYYMNSDELKEVSLCNVDIESHTTNHSKLDKLSHSERIKVLKDSKRCLSVLLNKDIKYIAYPFGRYNDEVIKDVKEEGYAMSFTTKIGLATTSQDLYELKRVIIPGYMSMGIFKKAVNN